MATYLVEMTGDCREVYAVEADSEEEAVRNWSDGALVIQESMGLDFYSVRKDED